MSAFDVLNLLIGVVLLGIIIVLYISHNRGEGDE
jgi:hypothetical protein